MTWWTLTWWTAHNEQWSRGLVRKTWFVCAQPPTVAQANLEFESLPFLGARATDGTMSDTYHQPSVTSSVALFSLVSYRLSLVNNTKSHPKPKCSRWGEGPDSISKDNLQIISPSLPTSKHGLLTQAFPNPVTVYRFLHFSSKLNGGTVLSLPPLKSLKGNPWKGNIQYTV